MSIFIQASSSISSDGSSFGIPTALGVLGAGAMTLHQSQNLQKFERHLKKLLSHLDQTKIDAEFLESERFKDIFIEISEAVRKTSSDTKLNALANILCGCFTKSGSTFINKEGMVRIVINMSEEEMKALYVIWEGEQKFLNQPETRTGSTPRVIVQEVSDALGWSAEDALIACHGLEQLNLIADPTFDGGTFDDNQKLIPGKKVFRTTNLATRLVLLARSVHDQSD